MEAILQVLWIDDEYEKLSSLNMDAADAGVKLNPYKSVEEGIAELKQNTEYYDGVLLDAKVFKEQDDVPGTEDVEYIFKAKKEIDSLSKEFDIHVLTGQAEAFDSNMFHKAFDKVFRKGINDDIDQLFESLVISARKQNDFQIKREYSDVFAVCQRKYKLDNSWPIVMHLIKFLDEDKSSVDTSNLFNPIRKVLENMFHGLNRFNLLPDNVAQNPGWLNGSSKFIAGKHKDYRNGDGIATPAVRHILTSLMFTVQDACHMEGHLRIGVHEHLSQYNSDYLYKTSVYQLLDVLLWYKKYIDSAPAESDWEYTGDGFEPVEGLIGQDENGNFNCQGILLSYKRVEDIGASEGDKVRITKVIDNGNEYLKSKYPLFAINWSLLS